MDNRLYVLVSKDLPSIGYKAAQAGHAVAQWIYDNKSNDVWNNQFLILLEVDSSIDKWKRKIKRKGINFTEFREPDLDNEATAIALMHDGSMFKKLKLVGT